jgi:type 1 fimbriae regulatory protein FimE
MSKISYLSDQTESSASTVNGKVTRKPYKELRSREYLTSDEIDRLMEAASRIGRHGHRDKTLILIAYRHALRVTELVSLRWDMIDLKSGLLHVSRLKNGTDSVHPLRGPEIRALRRVKRDYPDSTYVFVSERGGPMTDSNVRKMVKRAGKRAELGFLVHPHMLRHSCGYKLANDGVDTRAIQHYMGHASIGNTVIYTQLSANRFKEFWKD